MKGVDVLLQSWRRVEDRFRDWDLHILGPDNGGYLSAMKSLATELKLKRVTFGGPVFGQDKVKAYQEASLFVLPSHSENFGMTVAESLAAGTPAIVTKGAPWGGLETHQAGWWVDPGVDSLTACLEVALARSSESLEAMGRAGREWMVRDHSWEHLGLQMAETYRWLLQGGEPPKWVRVE